MVGSNVWKKNLAAIAQIAQGRGRWRLPWRFHEIAAPPQESPQRRKRKERRIGGGKYVCLQKQLSGANEDEAREIAVRRLDCTASLVFGIFGRKVLGQSIRLRRACEPRHRLLLIPSRYEATTQLIASGQPVGFRNGHDFRQFGRDVPGRAGRALAGDLASAVKNSGALFVGILASRTVARPVDRAIRSPARVPRPRKWRTARAIASPRIPALPRTAKSGIIAGHGDRPTTRDGAAAHGAVVCRRTRPASSSRSAHPRRGGANAIFLGRAVLRAVFPY